MVIEAVFEDLNLKHKVIKEIEKVGVYTVLNFLTLSNTFSTLHFNWKLINH